VPRAACRVHRHRWRDLALYAVDGTTPRVADKVNDKGGAHVHGAGNDHVNVDDHVDVDDHVNADPGGEHRGCGFLADSPRQNTAGCRQPPGTSCVEISG
jgi:hypothetical protein